MCQNLAVCPQLSYYHALSYYPLHNAWFMAETNPYRHRLWPRGFSVLADEEPVGTSVRTRAGRISRKTVRYAA